MSKTRKGSLDHKNEAKSPILQTIALNYCH